VEGIISAYERDIKEKVVRMMDAKTIFTLGTLFEKVQQEMWKLAEQHGYENSSLDWSIGCNGHNVQSVWFRCGDKGLMFVGDGKNVSYLQSIGGWEYGSQPLMFEKDNVMTHYETELLRTKCVLDRHISRNDYVTFLATWLLDTNIY
jgi:hypothetical protein